MFEFIEQKGSATVDIYVNIVGLRGSRFSNSRPETVIHSRRFSTALFGRGLTKGLHPQPYQIEWRP